MVRLKDRQKAEEDAIERISIPYGAIKSICLQNLRDVGIIFQFLMVRLKEINSINTFEDFVEISIPYGAIKSIYLKTAFFISTTFQFLMVRLKVEGLYLLILSIAYFNSLWCD